MKIPVYKALDVNGKEVEGFYLQFPETTYCFKEDYQRNPVRMIHCLARDRMTDWGLPNELTVHMIQKDTLELVKYVESEDEYYKVK